MEFGFIGTIAFSLVLGGIVFLSLARGLS